MKVAIVGATGPTGIHLAGELRSAGSSPRLWCRSTTRLLARRILRSRQLGLQPIRFAMAALGTGLLISAESVERLEYRTDLLSVLGIWVDVLKATNQREIFATQFFLQFVYFIRQLLSFR